MKRDAKGKGKNGCGMQMQVIERESGIEKKGKKTREDGIRKLKSKKGRKRERAVSNQRRDHLLTTRYTSAPSPSPRRIPKDVR